MRVVVGLRGEPGFPMGTAQLRSSVEHSPFRDLEPTSSLHGVNAVVGTDGAIDVSILVRGDPVTIEGHRFYANLSHVGYYRSGNADEALCVMEAAAFQP